jgi:TP901 family phage tail tape measure protein
VAERTVTVRLRMLVAEWVSPLDRARAATVAFARDTKQGIRDLNDEMAKAAPQRRLHEVAEAATGMGVAVGAAFVGVAMAAARFDKAMDEVGAVSQASAVEMERLSEAAIKAGLSTQYSATQAANAMAELARAGLTTSQIIGGALVASLNLAAAGQLGLEESAVTIAKALHSFNLEGGKAGHVADVLAAAANKSATNVHEMALASKMSALVAAQMGLSFEETAGALALFADNALAGSDGGTSLKVMLMMLSHPTLKSQKLMKQLGIDMFDVNGEFIGLAGAASQLQVALGPLTQEMRTYAIHQIFGADASRAANILYKEGAARVKEYTDKVNDAGYAQRMAADLTDNLAGDWERLNGALETFAIKSGSGANDGLRGLTQGATFLVQKLAELPAGLTSTLVIVAGLTAGALLLFAGLTKVRIQLALANAQLMKMGPAGAKAAAGLSKVGKAASYAAAAMVGLQILGVVADQFAKPTAEANKLEESLAAYGMTSKKTGEMTRIFGNNLEHLSAEAAAAQSGFGQFMAGVESWIPGLRALNDHTTGFSATKAIEDIKGLDEALAGLIQQGRKQEAEGAFWRLTTLTGKSAEDLGKLLPVYTSALADANLMQKQSAKSALENAIANEVMGKGMEGAAESGRTLLQVIQALHGEALGLAKTEIDAEAALDDLIEGLKESKKGFDVNTEAGRTNKTNLLQLIDAAAAHGQKIFEQTNNMNAATEAYEEYLVRALASKDLTKAQKAELQGLIEKLANLPEFKAVLIELQTKAAETALHNLTLKVLALKDKTIRISAKVYWTSSGDLKVPGGTILKNDRGGVYEHAAVGTLRDAAVYSSVASGARYAFAEPSTGGEAFVPKNGNYARSTSIIDHAARWYGGHFAPGRSAAAGPSQVINNSWTIQPQRANVGVNEMRAWQAQANALARVGRSR